MQKPVLLLTATITPLAGLPALARIDPVVRLHDYKRALSFYLGLVGYCFDHIVFAENSASDLHELRSLVRQAGFDEHVEFISFNGLDFPPAYGRGYGEFKMVDYATEHSRFLSQRADTYVWKCTGRYIVHNLAYLVGSRPDCDLYCHMRDYAYKLCELYLLSWNRTAYEEVIRGVYHCLRNDIVPNEHTTEEALFRKRVEDVSASLRVVPRFRHVPIIEGYRGWDGSKYGDRTFSPKTLARRFAGAVAPWLWI